MWIDAVVPCVGFADYLRDTLGHLVAVVDDLVVVTSPTDTDTLAECVRWGVRAVRTEAHLSGGGRYDKAAAINAGLQHLRCGEWLLVTDADTLWPLTARRTLGRQELQRDCVYGADRWDCVGWTHYAAFVTQQGAVATDSVQRLPPAGCRESPRFEDVGGGGWLPPGFCQLWHSEAQADYAWAPGCDADGTDVLHARRWPSARRRLIPDLRLLHLLSAPATLGRDWSGRVSPAWGPPDLGERMRHAAQAQAGAGVVEMGPSVTTNTATGSGWTAKDGAGRAGPA